jgi:hypothetical protein
MSEVKLRPQLGMFDAISTGMAAILGAGIFAVIAPLFFELSERSTFCRP